MNAFALLCHYTVSACLLQVYSIFTSFVVQAGWTVLMFAAGAGASIETIQLLLDSGASASINDTPRPVCFHLEL
jgi:hypothetical protein